MAGNRFIAAALTAAAAVGGSVGGAVYQAATQSDARVAMGAAHDVTTRHGELVVRVDAGGADVTALAAVDPGTAGQVLTVGDAGIAVWRALSTGNTYPVQMLAGGLEGDWSALGASPAGSSASISGGQVSLTMAASSCDWTIAPCSTDATRAVRSIPYYTMSDWSLRARIVSVTASASFVPMFGITTSATTWSTAVAKYVVYFAGNSDALTLMRVAGGGVTAGGATIASIRSGEGWVRMDHLGGRLIAYGGVGVAGAEPTSWTVIGGVAMTGTDPPPQRVVIGAHGSAAATIVWDSVRLQAVE